MLDRDSSGGESQTLTPLILETALPQQTPSSIRKTHIDMYDGQDTENVAFPFVTSHCLGWSGF